MSEDDVHDLRALAEARFVEMYREYVWSMSPIMYASCTMGVPEHDVRFVANVARHDKSLGQRAYEYARDGLEQTCDKCTIAPVYDDTGSIVGIRIDF